MIDIPDVRPGQVWADADYRAGGNRTLRVEEVVQVDGVAYAVCTRLTDYYGDPVPEGARSSRIRVDRMRPTSTGYRLVSEVTT